jgi:hypothetical protein
MQGRYCHVCGQENIVPRQSFWGLIKHFVYDIFHFDGKFFDTLRNLFFKPGTISLEYVNGKRMRYLDPIRMYLFTSAVFFLILFSLQSSEDIPKLDQHETLSKARRLDLAMEVNKGQQQRPGDSVLQQQMKLLMDTTFIVGLAPLNDTATYHSVVHYQGNAYHLTARKDSGGLLFEGEAKGWFQKTLVDKWSKFEKKYSDDPDQGLRDFLSGLLHKLPYLLFVSLPFFAGILKLLNLRRRNFYYSDHAVFTLHHYIISFILLLFYIAFDSLQNVSGWGIFGSLAGLMFLLWPLYLLIGMKRFYQQRWGTTLGKFLLVNMLGMITLILLLLMFLFLSIFQL